MAALPHHLSLIAIRFSPTIGTRGLYSSSACTVDRTGIHHSGPTAHTSTLQAARDHVVATHGGLVRLDPGPEDRREDPSLVELWLQVPKGQP